MPAKKARTADESIFRRAADCSFCAARIGHQRAVFRGCGNCRKRFNRRANRQRDIHQVRAAHRAREIPRDFLHRAARQRRLQNLRAVESYN